MPLKRLGGLYEELTVSRFGIEAKGLLIGAFRECSGLSGEVAVETYNEGGLNDYTHRFPGRTSYGDVTLKTGVINGLDFWHWFADTSVGKVEPRTVSIIAYSQDQSEVLRWNLTGAFPSRWEGPSFTAGDTSALLHSLTLSYQTLFLITGR